MNKQNWNREDFGAELSATLGALLHPHPDAAALARAAGESAAAAEALCEGRPMACGPSCPYCCVLNVSILLPEGMIIAQWLRQRLSGPQLAEVQESLSRHRSWARWMDDEERILKRMACPLLDEAGSCGVHPVRPLACRGVTSLDSDCCRAAFAPVVTDEARLVPADLWRKEIHDAAFTALAAALARHGIDDRSIELGAGVLAFLEQPERAELLFSGTRLPGELWR